MIKAVATAAAITIISTATAVSTHDDEQDRSSWTAASALAPVETRLRAADPTDTARREAEVARAIRSRSLAIKAEELRLRRTAAAKAAGLRAAQLREAARDATRDQAARDRVTRDRLARRQAAAARRSSATAEPARRVATSSGSSAAGQGALAEAPDHAGKPYEYGATGPDSFDCSGFTSYLFSRQGLQLPRTARDQYAASSKVDTNAKQPGDLIFTYDSGGVHHVGIYAGSGSMWAATKSGDVVRKQSISNRQYHVGRFG